MKHDLAEVLRQSEAHATLDVQDTRWQLYIFGLTRVGRDVLLQIAVVGPTVRTVTVRAPAPIGNRETARRVLGVVSGWVADHAADDQGYLELPNLNERAS